METVTKEFEKEDTLYYSEYVNKQFPAILYWISNNEDYEKAIKQFEEKHNVLVYHVILTPTYDNGIVLPYYMYQKHKKMCFFINFSFW